MFEFFPRIIHNIHPILTHFPIAFLVASFVLVIAKRRWEIRRYGELEWPLFAIGTLSLIPAILSGYVTSYDYAETNASGLLATHQVISFSGLLVLLGALAFRYRSRKITEEDRTYQEIGKTDFWIGFSFLAFIWLVFVGGTGGSLTYDHGVNVQQINPLIRKKQQLELQKAIAGALKEIEETGTIQKIPKVDDFSVTLDPESVGSYKAGNHKSNNSSDVTGNEKPVSYSNTDSD